MITVCRGEWRTPTFTREDKKAYYEELRRPRTMASGNIPDVSTQDLPPDQTKLGTLSIEKATEKAMLNEHVPLGGMIRSVWMWCAGYVLREKFHNPRVQLTSGTAGIEMLTTREELEIFRQQIFDLEEEVDEADPDGLLRAVSRRALIEYCDLRSFRRICGHGNKAVVNYTDGDAQNTLLFGGNWQGASMELAMVIFPDIVVNYTPPHKMEYFLALMNAVASCPRDEREKTTNSLLNAYRLPGTDLGKDMKSFVEWIDSLGGSELALVGHAVVSGNCGKRYIMLAVLLAAVRLKKLSVKSGGGLLLWESKSLEYSRRMNVPDGSLSLPQHERDARIRGSIDHLWPFIEAINISGTDSDIENAQMALRQWIDEEAQHIAWRQEDPVILWSICAALYYILTRIEGLSTGLLDGDGFQYLKLDIDSFEAKWLKDIYASDPSIEDAQEWKPRRRE